MIILGCDHGGFDLKEYLKSYLQKTGHDIVDVGAFSVDPLDDFPKYAKIMAKTFNDCPDSQVIAICGSGVGMSIALNRNKGIYCVLGYDESQVAKAREHNNANALALGGRTISKIKARKLVDAFLNTKFLHGKYEKRMKELD